jgi:hypothetical protein
VVARELRVLEVVDDALQEREDSDDRQEVVGPTTPGRLT